MRNIRNGDIIEVGHIDVKDIGTCCSPKCSEVHNQYCLLGLNINIDPKITLPGNHCPGPGRWKYCVEVHWEIAE